MTCMILNTWVQHTSLRCVLSRSDIPIWVIFICRWMSGKRLHRYGNEFTGRSNANRMAVVEQMGSLVKEG